MRRLSSRGSYGSGITWLLALMLLLGGVFAAGAHHDHDSGHHAGCPSCRLADETAGALPVVETAPIILPAIALLRPIAVERTPMSLFSRNSHRLRAPPSAA